MPYGATEVGTVVKQRSKAQFMVSKKQHFRNRIETASIYHCLQKTGFDWHLLHYLQVLVLTVL